MTAKLTAAVPRPSTPAPLLQSGKAQTQRLRRRKEENAMIKHELAKQISRETGYSLDEAEEIINSAISIILRTLSSGDQIKLSDFGRFSLSPTGRVLFKPYLLTKKIVNHTVEAPKEPDVLYKVRRTKVKDSFKEAVEEAEPRTIEVRKISAAEPERLDYSELLE